jgi:hypothetical protein
MAAKPWLRDYFKRLAENIESNEITSESMLSATVKIPIKGWYRGRTLLQALEYDKEYVQPEYPIQIGTSKPRVDFLLGRDANKWMLDLKKPGEACDKSKHVGQIQSYLGQEKISFGILFNGTLALAYINPDHEYVSDLCKGITEKEIEQMPQLDLKTYPVSRVTMNSGETREMVRFFQMLRFDGGMPDIKSLVRKLAGDYIKRVRTESKASVRFNEITSIVRQMLHNPDENFIGSIIASSSQLSQLRVTPKEISEIWTSAVNGLK